ncbi:AraC family transcriptional regulator [Chloroflexia bacterium SDU3-3]|nr:AraC family transcriptional regulator [Chloroflexia bacterium SDU3-3]
MDPLSDVLSLLRPHTYTVRGFDHGGAFSVRFPQHAGVKCYMVVSGELWLVVDGEPAPVHAQAGDCLLLLRGMPFTLTSDLALPPVSVASLNIEQTRNGDISTIDGGGACFTVGGHFLIEGHHADVLFGLLPPIVHLRSEADRAALRWALEHLMHELRFPQPGSVLIAQQLAYSMLVQALRLHLSDGGERVGWLFALADPQLGRALHAMHEAPAHPWTLHELARVAGMSRSSFAEKFRRRVGKPAMEYLIYWRMLRAADLLATTADPVGAIALALGYESESAFSAAFKRVLGRSPRQYARGHAQAG